MLSGTDTCMNNDNAETCIPKKEPMKTQKHDEMQYLELIQHIIDHGSKKEDRTGRMEDQKYTAPYCLLVKELLTCFRACMIITFEQ